jgi:hypothetical protein
VAAAKKDPIMTVSSVSVSSRIALFAVLTSIGLAAPAAADSVLCVKEKNGKPKGGIKVRNDSCKDKETQLDLAGFGLDGLRADLEAEIAGLESRVAEAEALVELLAVQQNHAEERGSINDFSETAFTSMVDLGTVAPADGFLMVWANLNAEYDINTEGDANVDLDCRIVVDGVASSITVDQEFARVAGGTNSGESVAVTTVVPVSAGDRSVALECRTTGAGLVFVKARSLTTLFVPLQGEVPSVLPAALPFASAKAAASFETNE